MCDEVVGGDVVVGERGGKGEPAPRQVKGGSEGVHVLEGRQAPSEQTPRVGVAGAVVQGDLRQHHGVRDVAGEDVVSVGGDGAGGEDVVDGGGPGGAVAGGEVGGSVRGYQAVPGREWAHGSERGGQGGARGACAVEVTQEDAQVGTHAGAEGVHEFDLGHPLGVREARGEVGVEQEGVAPE